VTRSAATERIRALAAEQGFEPVGVASLSPAPSAPHYREWLARGDHGGMSWMARNVDLREDPRGLLPGAMSALVVGLRYPAGEEVEEPPGIWRWVARYARGRDYHLTMRERLGAIAQVVAQEFPGTRCRVCVDTAPLLERDLAVRAGVGAIGKNTMLLHPVHGSWFLLGELLTTLDLQPDSPISDLCGACSRCLEACPTEALPVPYRLDANRCISYLTIEHRGAIPAELQPALVEHLFGCDICQEVCPWNSRTSGGDPTFRLGEDRSGLQLVDLLRLGEEEFRRRFSDSPLGRPKRAGIRRNAILAAAGVRSPEIRRLVSRLAGEVDGGGDRDRCPAEPSSAGHRG